MLFIEIKKYEPSPENAICSASHPSGIKDLRVNINDMDYDISAVPVGEHIKDISASASKLQQTMEKLGLIDLSDEKSTVDNR